MNGQFSEYCELSFFIAKIRIEKLTENFWGGCIITLYTYATFENTTSDAGTTKVDNKRRI